jgi:hypothetical protein
VPEIPIFETLIDNSERPTDIECGNYARTAQTVDGQWLDTFTSTTFDICTDGNNYYASFEESSLLSTLESIPAVSSSSSSPPPSSSSSSSSDTSPSSSSSGSSDTISVAELIASGANIVKTKGYQYGTVYEAGNVWKFFGTLADGRHFAMLAIRQNTRTVNVYYWCAFNKYGRAQAADFDTTECHGTFPLTRSTTTVVKQDCSRNSFLAPTPVYEVKTTYSSYYTSSSFERNVVRHPKSSSSDASSVVACMLVVLVAAVFAL